MTEKFYLLTKRAMGAILPLMVCLLMAVSDSFAQDKAVSGVVKDAMGQPVIAATVAVKGTTVGVTTDIDGRYSISLPAGAEDLIFSYVGMKSQTVKVGTRTVIDITLQEDAQSLDEVVVVGYAAVRRRDLVGSVGSVGNEALTQMPVASVNEALTGRLAGVQVTTTEGDPDAEVKIRVRGAGSLTQDSSPLYIVDGFPVESISDIPASDIESIDVLKDAFSTAIYGSRGANGVIIVTTKSGEKGRVRVNYNAYWGFKEMANQDGVKAMEPGEFARFQYEMAAMQDKVGENYEPYFGAFQDIDLYDTVAGNDWVDQLFGRTGEQFSQNLSVSGGGDKYKWTASYAHLDDKAIMIGSDYKRDNLNLKAQFKPNKRVAIDVSVRYSDMEVRGSGANSLNDKGTSTTGRLKNALSYMPIPLKGIIGGEDVEETSSDWVQPLVAVADTDRERIRKNWNANGAFSWEIVDDLKLKVELGLDDYRQTTHSFYGLTTYYSRDKSSVLDTPSAFLEEVQRERFRNTNTLSYDFKKLLNNDAHSLNVMVGQEYMITKSNALNTVVDGLPVFFDANMAWKFMGSGTPSSVSKFYNPDDKLFSFFGRLNYTYKDKYIVSATMRADGSSKFSGDNQWGYFPSAAIAWRISGEEWLRDVRWIDNLKLRYSYGTAGNNNIPSGFTSRTYGASQTSNLFGSNIYWATTTSGGKTVMANPNLKWETTISHNIGLDFGFWGNRLSGSVDLYQNTTKDLLIAFPTQGSGYQVQYRNAGEIRNSGIELSINAAIVQKEKWGINLSGNIAFNKNEVMDLAQLNNTGVAASSGWNNVVSGDYQVQVGGALGDVYGYTTMGRYEVSDFDLAHYAATGEWVLNPGVVNSATVVGDCRPGSLKLADFDGDFAPDMGVIGNVQPDFTGGFSLSGYAYGFDIAANFTYSVGNKVYNASKLEHSASHKYTYKGAIRNLMDVMSLGNRWTNVDWTTGELITDPAALAAANETTTLWSPFIPNSFLHSWALEDASFLRLSSLTVGYTLPQALTRKVRLDKVRFYATGTNLFCLTDYSGFDPEVDTRRATPLTPNVDYSAYPKSRSWVFGVNISF
nr:TonB-dependent receptor [Rikenellaceae bacterium]